MFQHEPVDIEPIGKMRTCFGEKFAVPRQPGLCPSAWGEIHFHEPYRGEEFLRGIEGFSHIWVIFGFHQTQKQGWSPTVRPPRLGGNERVGVFASRSTYRPNGLGLSLCRLEKVKMTESGLVLLVGGIDLVDQTPVYDIKPYLPYAESIPSAKSGYARESPETKEVVIEERAMADFDRLSSREQAVIREALSLDPRPATHQDPMRIYGAILCGKNVRFRVDRHVWVEEIATIDSA